MITEKKISELLRQLGIAPSYIGFQYLVKGLLLFAEKGSTYYTDNFVKLFYGDITKCFPNATGSRVERAIRHAIEMSITRGDIKLQEEIYLLATDAKKANPTNKEFVFSVYEYLRLNETEG